MLANGGFVKILGVKAYAEGAIRLLRVGQGRYPLCWSSDLGIDSEGNHVVKGLLNLAVGLRGYLLIGVLDRGNGGGQSKWYRY